MVRVRVCPETLPGIGKTTRKSLAGSREKGRRLELEQQFTTGARPTDPSRMMRTVREAVESYVASYDAPTHQPKSIAWVKERMPHVIAHLGQTALFEISESKVLGYMRTRQKEGAGNRTINMELMCLSRAAGATWSRLWPKVPRLSEATDVGQALSPDEEGRLLGAALKNKSPYIVPFVHIALSTGMRSGEITRLRLERINLAGRELRVGKAKTKAGGGTRHSNERGSLPGDCRSDRMVESHVREPEAWNGICFRSVTGSGR